MSPGERTSSPTSRRATSVRRRQLLAAAGATTSLGVAGCLGFGNGDSGSDADSSNGTDDNGTVDTNGSTGDGDGEASDDGTDGDDDGSGDDSDGPGGDEPGTWTEGGPPDREGWEVAFFDRFEGGELDDSKWDLGAGMGMSPPCGTLECWAEDHVRVDGENDRLVIETSEEPYGDYGYTSGGITAKPALEQEFGYFEARSRPPAVPGSLPAFWMWWNPPEWGHRREIDVYEITGDQPFEPIHNVHVDCEPREPGEGSPEWRGGRSTISPGADEAFHVWGVEWSPEAVTFYVDGEETVRVEDEIVGNCLAGEAMWVVLSTHVNEDMGDPTAAEYPYTHEFEWVRVWQRDDWE